jgi:hypothetical protein
MRNRLARSCTALVLAAVAGLFLVLPTIIIQHGSPQTFSMIAMSDLCDGMA